MPNIGCGSAVPKSEKLCFSVLSLRSPSAIFVKDRMWSGDIKNQKNDVFSFAVASIFHNFAWKCSTRRSGALIDLKQIGIMHIGVFCSANADIDPDFFELTRQFGEWMGRNGHMLVFGGCNLGLMECVARAVHEAGGLCIGAVPTIVEKGGRTSDYVDVKIMCDNLSDRKDIMVAKSDVLVALPGGVGTLDEIFTVVASASIGYHHKRVILYNMKGFWNPLLTMLDSMKKAGVIRRGFDDQLLVASTQDELVEMLSREG